ncbi:hypothetical protein L2E82_14185 [Cichorium intybus]|uniref:Uncharacterized protein n=1 Tax=Cichorium intybus TaxID=13427 RepID=A0ACB9EZB6_CICIN|nr:hypothetical protein L2E82_14185 [Cichorium intybus]
MTVSESLSDVTQKRRRIVKIAAVRANSGVVIEKEQEFKPSFEEYLKVMETVKVRREKRKASTETPLKKLDSKEPQVAAKVKIIKGAPTNDKKYVQFQGQCFNMKRVSDINSVSSEACCSDEVVKKWTRNKSDSKEVKKASGSTEYILHNAGAKCLKKEGRSRYCNSIAPRSDVQVAAESLGLPLVPPFLHDKESGNVMEFRHGVNYAVVGSTALDTSFLEPRGIVNTMTNVSFGCQLAWFKQSLPYICTNVSDCRNFIEHSLFLVGKIGNNDYGYPFIAGKPIDEVEPFVPLITDTIISAVNEFIDMGAKTLIVPGSVPLGCLANYLTVLGSINEEYDKTTGCLVKFNKFSEYHNEMLQTKLQHLRELYPNVNIIYADYYNAAMRIIRSPLKFGFTNGALRACCGSGGPYNYNLSAECGMRSATESLCDDPDTYANWDGIHFTEAANRIISKSLFQGPYTWPRFDSLCPSSPSQYLKAMETVKSRREKRKAYTETPPLPKIKEETVELSDSQEQINVGKVGNSEQGEIKKTWKLRAN